MTKAERVTDGGVIDPNASRKDIMERRLLRILKNELGEQFEEILALLGDPPDINNLTPEVWVRLTATMAANLRPELEQMAREAAGRLMIDRGVGVDWTLVAEEAAGWAASYSYSLVKDITDTTRRVLQESVEQFLREPGRTIGDLTRDIEPYFGQMRAEMIAVTETTRAFAEGERLAVKEALAIGLKLEPTWNTAGDEKVCSICAPNDSKMQREGWTEDWPPAHPRCRCWVTHKWVE